MTERNYVCWYESNKAEVIENILEARGFEFKMISTPMEILDYDPFICKDVFELTQHLNEQGLGFPKDTSCFNGKGELLWKVEQEEQVPATPQVKQNVILFPNKAVDLPFMLPVKENLKKAYLDPSNNYPWFVANSNGKDSTCMASSIVEVLEEIPAALRKRKVIFATSDTLLENPQMKALMETTVQNMNQMAKEQNLPVEAALVKPKMTAMMKMLGHGTPLPTPKNGALNRWCTPALKLNPMEDFQKALIEEHGSIIVMLGVRTEESVKRAESIKKHTVMGEFIFPQVESKQNEDGSYKKYMCHPIVQLTTEEVWQYITHKRVLPWGVKATTIRAMYEGAGECPIQVDRLSSKPCGGSSRNGCMLCQMANTKNNDDQMLLSFIQKGEKWAVHMNKLRKLFRESLYDARFRKPIQHWRKLKLDWANPFVQNYDEKVEQLKNAKRKAEKEAFQSQFDKEKELFTLHSEGICPGTSPVYPNLDRGGYNLQGRIFLYKAIRAVEEETGIEMISEREEAYIFKRWKEEFGWMQNEEDLTPEFPDYKGALVLNTDYTVNIEDTSIPNLTIYEDAGEDGMGMVIPPVYNKLLNPKPRKRKKITKTEELAQATLPFPKTINLDLQSKERNFVFYIDYDWAGTEVEIIASNEKSALHTKKHISYYWMPNGDWETRHNKDTDEEERVWVHWNTVTYIVCEEHIKTKEAARKYVEAYVQAATPPKVEEMDWSSFYDKKYRGVPAALVRKDILLSGLKPELVSTSLRKYTNLTTEELEIAQAIKWFRGGVASQYCKGDIWERVVWELFEGMNSFEARITLLGEKQFNFRPEHIPTSLKEYTKVSDRLLNLADRIRSKEPIRNKLFWRHFDVSILLEDVSKQEALEWLKNQSYQYDEIPSKVVEAFDITLEEFASFTIPTKEAKKPAVKKHFEFDCELKTVSLKGTEQLAFVI